MDKKILAVAVVAVVVVAAVGVYAIYNQDDDDTEINIIARVNTEGSGIALRAGTDVSQFMTYSATEVTSDDVYCIENTLEDPAVEGDEYLVFYIANWGGQVFGTPGTATIQHIQFQDFVTNCLGLNFEPYSASNSSNDPNTVYYNDSITSYERFVNATECIGFYLWEPQYSLALSMGCESLVTSNQLFSGHTCCVIAGSHEYMQSHEDVTVRFLAAYVEAVDRLNAAISSPGTDEYEEAVQIAINVVTWPTGTTDEQKRETIVNAFELITYTYADNTGSSPLSQLVDDIADLVESLTDNNNLTRTVQDSGYETYEDFAEELVDDSYLAQALEYELTGEETTTTITVAVIDGDIHQLAIHYGIYLGIFEEYGIDIELSMQSNGSGVAVALENGGADFGLIGAPPACIRIINSQLNAV